jgi:hypothetical protein
LKKEQRSFEMHKKSIAPVWFLVTLCLVMGAGLFIGCGNTVNPVDIAGERAVNASDPIGVWYSSGPSYDEVFDITSDYIGYYVNDDLVFDGKIVLFLPDPDSKNSGIIYLQYQNTKYGIPNYFYAVRWQELDPDEGTVWLSACSDGDGKKELLEAEREYSEANKDKYFQYGSDFSRIASRKALPPSKKTGKPPIIEHLERQKALKNAE